MKKRLMKSLLALLVLVNSSAHAADVMTWISYGMIGVASVSSLNTMLGGWAYWKTRLQLKRNKEMTRKVGQEVQGVKEDVQGVKKDINDFRGQHQRDVAELHRGHGAINENIKNLRQDVGALKTDFNAFRADTTTRLDNLHRDMHKGFLGIAQMLSGTSNRGNGNNITITEVDPLQLEQDSGSSSLDAFLGNENTTGLRTPIVQQPVGLRGLHRPAGRFDDLIVRSNEF